MADVAIKINRFLASSSSSFPKTLKRTSVRFSPRTLLYRVTVHWGARAVVLQNDFWLIGEDIYFQIQTRCTRTLEEKYTMESFRSRPSYISTRSNKNDHYSELFAKIRTVTSLAVKKRTYVVLTRTRSFLFNDLTTTSTGSKTIIYLNF